MASVNGLEGVVAAETELSLVDGQNGHLVYRGYWARDLAITKSFEEAAHLMWYGRLPDAKELADFKHRLAHQRQLPDYAKNIIELLPRNMEMMSVLQAVTSSLGAGFTWPPTVDQALYLTAKLPTIIAYREALMNQQTPLEPDPELDHVANYLYMLHGEAPTAERVSSLTAYWILAMEHGMNASTFTCRVVTSSQSDLASAIAGAIGTMKGPLHGGAPSEVFDMLDDIGEKDRAEAWLRSAIERGEKLMGFGHRVYKTYDPRAEALRTIVQRYEEADPWFALARHVEEVAIRLLKEYKPNRQLYTNVEFYAAAILRAIHLPKTVYPATFTASRVVGWCANALEQSANNRIIRPDSKYIGPMPE